MKQHSNTVLSIRKVRARTISTRVKETKTKPHIAKRNIYVTAKDIFGNKTTGKIIQILRNSVIIKDKTGYRHMADLDQKVFEDKNLKGNPSFYKRSFGRRRRA